MVYLEVFPINTTTIAKFSESGNKNEVNGKGKRLAKILDHVGFPGGRGRVVEFQRFLMAGNPDIFSELKYTTVRGWFRDNCPKSSVMEAILVALMSNYGQIGDIKLTKAWWRLGGDCPLTKVIDKNGHKNIKNTENKDISNTFFEMIENINSVYVAQIYLLVYQLAATAKINIASDIPPDASIQVFNKILQYCKEKQPEVDDPDLKNLVLSLLRLAKEGLL